MRIRTMGVTLVALASLALTSACTSASSGTANSATGTAGGPSAQASSPPVAKDAAISALLPAKFKTAGKLRVATDVTYPPFESMAEDNKTIVGADIDLINALGGLLGVKIELLNTPFAGIIPGIAAGKYDLALSGMADRPARRAQITFVDYATNGVAFVTAKAGAAKYPSWASTCGGTIAVQTGTTMADNAQTTSDACVKNGKAVVTVNSYASQDEAVLALRSGRAGVMLTTGGSGAYIVSHSSSAFAMAMPTDTIPGSNGSLGLGVPKAETGLVTALQQALKVVVANGTYKTIMTKWGLAQCCTNTSGTVNDK